MSYNHLTPEERGKIEAYLDEGVSQAEIARRLNRNRSMISREIRRNREERKADSLAALRYQASSAGNLARMRKRNCGTTTKATVHNTKTILKYLKKKYSPEQIANGVRSSINVSTNTIYNWIYSGLIKFPIKKLRLKGKRYQEKNSGRLLKKTPSPQFYENRLVTDRPETTILRTDFGNWEADTVLSKRGVETCLATFVERKSRHYVAIKITRKDSVCMLAAMERLIEMYPTAVKSITCDRGVDFVNFHNVSYMENTYGTKIYFAHPYAPHERGSNEYHNGLLREYFPKPTDFNKISQTKINQSTNEINDRPRKLFKWKSANHKFHLEYAKT
jgi:IS30 family transposase